MRKPVYVGISVSSSMWLKLTYLKYFLLYLLHVIRKFRMITCGYYWLDIYLIKKKMNKNEWLTDTNFLYCNALVDFEGVPLTNSLLSPTTKFFLNFIRYFGKNRPSTGTALPLPLIFRVDHCNGLTKKNSIRRRFDKFYDTPAQKSSHNSPSRFKTG